MIHKIYFKIFILKSGKYYCIVTLDTDTYIKVMENIKIISELIYNYLYNRKQKEMINTL